MAVKAIAYSYWRSVKRGARTYDSVPPAVRDDVRTLALEDVESGVITADEYEHYISEPHPGEEVTV